MDIKVHITAEIIETTRGQWCERCNRSTGYQAAVMLTIGQRISIGTHTGCIDCGPTPQAPRLA